MNSQNLTQPSMTLTIVWCLMVLMLSLCVYAQADDAQAAWSEVIANCINDPDAQCDFGDFPTSWSVKCIDDPSSSCNNWYGPQVSAYEKAQREAAARVGEESPNLVEAKARAQGKAPARAQNGLVEAKAKARAKARAQGRALARAQNGSDLSHCVGLLDGVSDVRDKTKDWLGSNRAKPWSFNHIQTRYWFDFVSTGVSKVKMKFEAKDVEDKPFSGLAAARLKNSDCSVLSMIIRKCINNLDAQCDIDDFPTSWLVNCIDDPSSLCNNWYGPQVSAYEKAQGEAAARRGKESPNLVEAKARAQNKSDLSHCVGLLDGFSDVRDKTKDWLGSNRAKPWSFNHIQTRYWFDFVSTGVSKVKMKFEAKDIEDNPFSGLAAAELKNSDCSVLSMTIRINPY